MGPVGSDSKGHINAIVDQQQASGGMDDAMKSFGQCCELPGLEIFFPQLKDPGSSCEGGASHLLDRPARGLRAIGDNIKPPLTRIFFESTHWTGSRAARTLPRGDYVFQLSTVNREP